jgi:hypothetical protein
LRSKKEASSHNLRSIRSCVTHKPGQEIVLGSEILETFSSTAKRVTKKADRADVRAVERELLC